MNMNCDQDTTLKETSNKETIEETLTIQDYIDLFIDDVLPNVKEDMFVFLRENYSPLLQHFDDDIWKQYIQQCVHRNVQ